jgi:hypothetical protein
MLFETRVEQAKLDRRIVEIVPKMELRIRLRLFPNAISQSKLLEDCVCPHGGSANQVARRTVVFLIKAQTDKFLHDGRWYRFAGRVHWRQDRLEVVVGIFHRGSKRTKNLS